MGSSPFAVIYFYTPSSINLYFHVLVFELLYSCKYYISFELLETQILKTRYWYKKKRRKIANLLSFVHAALLETNIIGVSYFFIEKWNVKTTVLVNICEMSIVNV